jgi:hypothetical protein
MVLVLMVMKHILVTATTAMKAQRVLTMLTIVLDIYVKMAQPVSMGLTRMNALVLVRLKVYSANPRSILVPLII